MVPSESAPDISAVYAQLGELTRTVPDFSKPPDAPETLNWLGRVTVLVERVLGLADTIELKNNIGLLYNSQYRKTYAYKILAILYRALASAEAKTPIEMQGAFIPVGSPYDALVAVGKVIKLATSEVFFVDPYADHLILERFAIMAEPNIKIRILTGVVKSRTSLKPSVECWRQQYVDNRPLEVRLSSDNVLHDRIIVIDNHTIYVLGQSFNSIASRSPTSINRSDSETSALKIAAYQELWLAAMPI